MPALNLITTIKLKLFNHNNNKKKLLLDFLYWREKEIHPSDANKIVDKFLEQNDEQTRYKSRRLSSMGRRK